MLFFVPSSFFSNFNPILVRLEPLVRHAKRILKPSFQSYFSPFGTIQYAPQTGYSYTFQSYFSPFGTPEKKRYLARDREISILF